MTIDDCRRQIDEIDRQLVSLLNRRAELAGQIGRLKADGELDVFQPDREAAVIANVLVANGGPLSVEAIRAIYGEILSACRAMQRPVHIAYLGPPATFTHEAAKRRFGSAATYVPSRSIADVFQDTQKGVVDYGVVPVENSTEGVVSYTLDMFVDSELKVCAEIEMAVSHNLLSKGTLDTIKTVYSMSQAIAQSRRWLREHLPEVGIIEVASTALAAQMATTPDTAAIATESAAEVYGLPILARRIEDSATNVTRFLVIGPHTGRRTGNDKTSIMFSIRDRVGALHDALGIFARRGINLTRIESRPSRRRVWDYIFFVDFLGHPEDENVRACLAELDAECIFVKVLGAWPAGMGAP